MQVFCYNFSKIKTANREVTRMLTEVLYIGDRLRQLRKQSLMTQEQLAERSGVAVSTIIRIERNQVEPHGSTIRKLAEALEVEPQELVRRADDA
jgi:transcriptional regulator with XRE-family HTH domain